MTLNKFVSALILSSLLVSGCADKKIHLDPNVPVQKAKSEFIDRYGFFVTKSEMKIGYLDLVEPIASFEKISTLEELDKFSANFKKIRDTDPRTPENEFVNLNDSRIQDIKNEILSSDFDLFGTRFDNNGGLRGDMAHVYLMYGMPSYKEKLTEGNYISDLMVWYYIDYSGKPLFRFLFYKQGGYGRIKLFRNYFPLLRFEDLFDPLTSPLKEVSKRMAISPDDLFEVWSELEIKDSGWLFRAALFEFSYYSDVVIEGGNKNRLGALDPPEPAAITAQRFKPLVLGQPEITDKGKFSMNGYHSFIPAYLRVKDDSKNITFLMLTISFKNLDWEKQQDDKYITELSLRISFQNKDTLKSTEFFTKFKKEISQKEFDSRDSLSLVVFPVKIKHWDGEKLTLTLGEMIKKMEPGNYIINIHLQNIYTKKYNAWREEVVIN